MDQNQSIEPVETKRPAIVTLIAFLTILQFLFSLCFLGFSIFKGAHGSQIFSVLVMITSTNSQLTAVIASIIIIFNMIAAIGLLKMSKFAVYSYMFTAFLLIVLKIVGVIFSLSTISAQIALLYSLVTSIIPIAIIIYLWVIRRQFN